MTMKIDIDNLYHQPAMSNMMVIIIYNNIMIIYIIILKTLVINYDLHYIF